jgi:hypothetical protein
MSCRDGQRARREGERERGQGHGGGGDGQCMNTMGQGPGGEVIASMTAHTPNLDLILNIHVNSSTTPLFPIYYFNLL